VIDLSHAGSIAILTLAHGKANALDVELCGAITSRFEELQSTQSEAVVVTGQGTIFSAGVDLLRLLDGGPAYVRQFLPALHQLYETIFFFPRPVIAAVNGHAVAGGCVLACATDRRLMARDRGRIGVTELLVGVPFPAMAFEIMRFATAPHRFEETLFGAATYQPDAAVERGLIDEVVDPGALLDRAVAAARTLAAHSPAVFALTKRRSRQPVADRLAADGYRYDVTVETIWTAPETFDRIQAYVSRTFKKS
jgi:enoyl-CoA hydratase